MVIMTLWSIDGLDEWFTFGGKSNVQTFVKYIVKRRTVYGWRTENWGSTINVYYEISSKIRSILEVFKCVSIYLTIKYLKIINICLNHPCRFSCTRKTNTLVTIYFSKFRHKYWGCFFFHVNVYIINTISKQIFLIF